MRLVRANCVLSRFALSTPPELSIRRKAQSEVTSVNSGTPMMPMYTWTTQIPPNVRWSLSPLMMGSPILDHYICVPGSFADSPFDDVSPAIAVTP